MFYCLLETCIYLLGIPIFSYYSFLSASCWYSILIQSVHFLLFFFVIYFALALIFFILFLFDKDPMILSALSTILSFSLLSFPLFSFYSFLCFLFALVSIISLFLFSSLCSFICYSCAYYWFFILHSDPFLFIYFYFLLFVVAVFFLVLYFACKPLLLLPGITFYSVSCFCCLTL